jgi:hypothetical protein
MIWYFYNSELGSFSYKRIKRDQMLVKTRVIQVETKCESAQSVPAIFESDFKSVLYHELI